MSEQYVGEIRMFGFSFAPNDWALCNGQLLPISQNEALFALIGTTYGGDGVSNFALPNLQSRVPIHQGQGNGLSPYVIGEVGGVENVTLLTTQMPQHNHTAACITGGGNQASPANAYPAVESTGTSLDYSTAVPSGSVMNSNMISFAGGSQPHNNLQPFLCVNFCIALYGIFPSRN
jgi:microcystin-dependent protein